jgi:GMP synthase (glutamine-hydrolysing)
MKPILIIKTGSTYPEIAREMGDFEAWTAREMGLPMDQVAVHNCQRDSSLPTFDSFNGIVITGSHAMVTERLDWSERLAAAIPEIMAKKIPLLGICFGHQLMAQALGGRAGYHPKGSEVGTVDIHLSSQGRNDPLFSDLPSCFKAHVTHSQTVLELPPRAVVLARNDFEAHHGFRVGSRTWGIQFHPEFDEQAMLVYINAQAKELRAQAQDPGALKQAVTETRHSSLILQRFTDLARGKRL